MLSRLGEGIPPSFSENFGNWRYKRSPSAPREISIPSLGLSGSIFNDF
jgi:hypothetical protein